MTPKIKPEVFDSLSEFEIRVTVLIEFSRDRRGKIVGVNDIAFPTEDDMVAKVTTMIPENQKGEDFDLTSAVEDCPRFVVDPSLESFLESWDDHWKETLVGDFLCEVCKFVSECHPDLAKLHQDKGETVDVEKKEKKKQKPFKIALE